MAESPTPAITEPLERVVLNMKLHSGAFPAPGGGWECTSCGALSEDHDAHVAEVILRALRYEDLAPIALAALRTYDPLRVRSIAAGGGPRSDADHAEVYCVLCSCRKNGYPEEPNSVDECCEDPRCPCH